MRKFLLLTSVAIASLQAEPSIKECSNRAHAHFLQASHQEGNGIGYKQGYSSLDLFLSETPAWNLTPFLDLRGHYFNNGKYAANAGLGLRDSSEVLGVVFGINVFYDIRKVRRTHFQQVGPGLEVLGERWDFRANGYIPVGSRRKLISSETIIRNSTPFIQKKYEYNFIGGNAEIGRILVKNSVFTCKLSGGGYYLKGRFHQHAGGGYLRLAGHLSPFVGFQAQGSYDNLFRFRGFGELSLIFPFGPTIQPLKEQGCSSGGYFHPNEHFSDPVSRFEIIPTHSRKKRSII